MYNDMASRVLVSLGAALVGGAVLAGSAQSQTNPFILDGIVVTASPTPRALASVAQHVTILDGRELEALGFTTVADALRDVAGVDVARNGSFGGLTSLFLRGGESDYTLVMVDGVQVNQAGGGFDFASLTPQNVERIEIVRGPSSALYGSDAVAGVVHVISRSGQDGAGASVRAEAGVYEAPTGGAVDATRYDADLSGGTDRARYSVSVGRDAAAGVLAYNSRHENLRLAGSARFVPDDRTHLAIMLRLEDRQYNYPTNGAGTLVDRNTYSFEDEVIAQVSAARTLTDALTVEALVGLAETDGGIDDAFDDPADTDAFRSLDHFHRSSVQVMSHLAVGSGVFTVGGEVEEERQRSFSESLSGFGPFYGRSEAERVNLAAFAHASSERGPVSLSLGGRLEDNERFGNIATWQAGLTARLPGRPGTRLRVAAGSAIKEPTFAENYATGFALGNPDLDPEWSLSWEVGLEHDVLPGAASVSVTYFDQRFEEMIQYTFAPPTPTSPNYFNVGAASARGVETEVHGRAGSVDLGGAWTWLDTEVTDVGLEGAPGDLFVDGEPLIRRPEHSFSLSASSPVSTRARVHTRVARVGARGDRDFSTFPATPVVTAAYTLWSAGAEYTVLDAAGGRPSLRLSLRGENLLDESYQEAFGFDAPGRQLYVGVSLALGGAGATP
ncbi:MAG: TonB-dependent receptor plug domain-containing protein [Gemmatimonadales bacterium]